MRAPRRISRRQEPRDLASTWQELRSSPEGIAPAEAARRLETDGPNVVATHLTASWPRLLLSQLGNPLVLLLLGAAILSLALGEHTEAVVIIAIVSVNAALGFYQEYRAERALTELARLVRATARVRRGGETVRAPAEELVRGDVVLLAIGDIVPADLRLFAAAGLALDEAALTGESVPVDKGLEATLGAQGTRGDMAYLGTTVVSGHGEGVVVETGGRTLMGTTAAGLHAARPETDFQGGIRRFSAGLLVVVLVLSAFLFAVHAFMGRGIFDSLLFALALAVGVAPEALPVVITLALSRGALRLAAEKVVVRRLIAIEDLGNVDILCCDKTGTLTTGEPAYVRSETPGGREEPALFDLALLSAAQGDARGSVSSAAPLDEALWKEAARTGVAGRVQAIPVLARNEFGFERRRSSVVADPPGGRRLIVKGAPEAVLLACTRLLDQGAERPLDDASREAARQRAVDLEAQGFRVIALASRAHGEVATTAADERDLSLEGFVLLVDPPKPEAAEALRTLARLGVAVKMITGDSPTVARRICGEVGLELPGGRVLSGSDVAGMTVEELRLQALQCAVFARVAPEEKRRIVAALASGGHVVGFLGDGVNDAPALRASDVGISVDTGAAVAKEAADIVLLRKGLDVLARGIMEGRRTFANVTKYVLNTVSANFGNMSTLAVSSLFLPFIPLLPAQVLLNNLLSDGPLLTISTDKVDRDLLARPRRWNLALIGRFMVIFGILSAVFDLLLLFLLTRVVPLGVEALRTAWFVESACSEVLVTFAIRTRLPFYRSAPSAWLLGSSVAALLAALALPYSRAGQDLFAFVPLSAQVVGLVGSVLVGYFAAAEIAKRYFFSRIWK